MNEFTGERVIPGQVNDDLWAEHIARYVFAQRYASNTRVLDVGCGTGYGTASLAQHSRFAIGVDVSLDAIEYARSHYSAPAFLAASATALPFQQASFGLITAFEVIEHLSDWLTLLSEARRVLAPSGVFLVSTPNKLYYAESRAAEGPNPFHTHEFEFAEFRDALAQVFPHVEVLLQDRAESQVFYPVSAGAHADAHLDSASASGVQANFFLAVCSLQQQPETRSFLYVPRAANLLREREQHISLLQDELVKNKQWLAKSIADHKALLTSHDELKIHLEEQNRWALQLDRDWKASLERVVELQDTLQVTQAEAIRIAEAYEQTVSQLEEENRRKVEWAIETERRLSAALAAKCDELAETVRLLDTAEATVVERTKWAQSLDEQVRQFEALLQMIRQSRWLKLGRLVSLGPNIDDPNASNAKVNR